MRTYGIRTTTGLASTLGYILHDDGLYKAPPGSWQVDPSQHDLLRERPVYFQNVTSAGHALAEMERVTDLARNAAKRLRAYHIVQSFAPQEVREIPTAFELGVRILQRSAPGFQAVMATHITTMCLHNHIVVNSTSFERGLSFHAISRNRQHWVPLWMHLQTGTVDLMHEMGLQALGEAYAGKEMPFLSRHWGQNQIQETLNMDIRGAAQTASHMQEFYARLQRIGYEFARDEQGTVRIKLLRHENWHKLDNFYTAAELECMLTPEAHKKIEADRVRWQQKRLRSLCRLPLPEDPTPLENACAAYLCTISAGQRQTHPELLPSDYWRYEPQVKEFALLLQSGLRTVQSVRERDDKERLEANSLRKRIHALGNSPEELDERQNLQQMLSNALGRRKWMQAVLRADKWAREYAREPERSIPFLLVLQKREKDAPRLQSVDLER